MTEFERLKAVVARLRAEDGCPWDRAQTHDSLKPEVVEEAAEVVCGINILTATGNPDNLKEELGDLLLQVVMHAQIAEEEGLFTMEDVCKVVADKMIRRHPKVFGGETAGKVVQGRYYTQGEAVARGESAVQGENVALTWADIKKQEKAGKEWMEAYLPPAFDEAEALIGAARKRKGYGEKTK